MECYFFFFFFFSCSSSSSSSSLRFLDHTLILEVSRSHTERHNTVNRTSLDERSARGSYLWLTKHNTHKRQASNTPAGFEPSIPANERPQTLALHRSATGIDWNATDKNKFNTQKSYCPTVKIRKQLRGALNKTGTSRSHFHKEHSL